MCDCGRPCAPTRRRGRPTLMRERCWALRLDDLARTRVDRAHAGASVARLTITSTGEPLARRPPRRRARRGRSRLQPAGEPACEFVAAPILDREPRQLVARAALPDRLGDDRT